MTQMGGWSSEADDAPAAALRRRSFVRGGKDPGAGKE
jgi:hypothetical protein